MNEDSTHSVPAIICAAVVFGIPFAIGASFIVRQQLCLFRKGLFPPSRDRSAWAKAVQELRHNDEHMAYLHRRSFQRVIVTWIVWIIGFGILICYAVMTRYLSGDGQLLP